MASTNQSNDRITPTYEKPLNTPETDRNDYLKIEKRNSDLTTEHHEYLVLEPEDPYLMDNDNYSFNVEQPCKKKVEKMLTPQSRDSMTDKNNFFILEPEENPKRLICLWSLNMGQMNNIH